MEHDDISKGYISQQSFSIPIFNLKPLSTTTNNLKLISSKPIGITNQFELAEDFCNNQ